MKSYGDYSGLVAEFYDLWFQKNPLRDADTYRGYLNSLPGPALEIGSGTGRLLLPFLKEGFDIEGVDSSPHMNAICLRKARALGIKPVIHHQYMQNLSLKKLYNTILLPFAGLMVLTDREEAQAALTRFYEHLHEPGQLVLTSWIPHISMEESKRRNWHLRRETIRHADAAQVICNEVNTYDLVEQIKHGLYRYEIIKNGQVIKTHWDSQKFRWYSKYELILMLEKAGFKTIETTTDYNEQEIPIDHSALLVRAVK